jgi:hypothetical protein
MTHTPRPRQESVTAYHSGRRRYFSLKAACRDMARQRVFRALHEMGESKPYDDDWWRPRVDRLTRFYVRWAKIAKETSA